MPRWRIASAGIAALVAAAPALADPGGDPVRLIYSAPAECPSARSFASQVRERALRARDPERGERARTFRVQIEKRGSSLVGTLVIEEPSGAQAGRELAGKHCAEVVDALALVVALAIDPRASTAGPPPVDIDERPPEPLPEPHPPETVDPRQDAPRPGEHVSTEGGVHAGAVHGLSPGPQLEVGVTVGVLASGGGPLAPAAWAEWLHVPRRVYVRALGNAAFQAELLGLDVCPVAIRTAQQRAEMRACARLEAGRISAAGERTLNPRRSDADWLAPGLRIRAAFSPFYPLWLGATGAVVRPLARDRFLMGADVVHQLPPAALRVDFGLTVRPW